MGRWCWRCRRVVAIVGTNVVLKALVPYPYGSHEGSAVQCSVRCTEYGVVKRSIALGVGLRLGRRELKSTSSCRRLVVCRGRGDVTAVLVLVLVVVVVAERFCRTEATEDGL